MKLTIINIANKMPPWIADGCAEYLKRINHGKYSCKIIEIKADKNLNKAAIDNMAIEAKKIRNHIVADSLVIILDEHGIKLNSVDFAHKLERIALNNPNITFIIGGADGVHPELKQSAHMLLQLSNLTFPHALVRIIILEQIYRAITILENHPYHRE